MIRLSKLFTKGKSIEDNAESQKLRNIINSKGISVSDKEYLSIIEHLDKYERHVFSYSPPNKIFTIVFANGDDVKTLEFGNYIGLKSLYKKGVFGEPQLFSANELGKAVDYLSTVFILSEYDLKSLEDIYINDHIGVRAVDNGKSWAIINIYTEEILYKPNSFRRKVNAGRLK